MNRRQFAKTIGGAALATPLVPALVWTQEQRKPETPAAPAKPADAQAPPAEAAKTEPKLKLTAKQEENLKQALERRDRQLAGLRSRTLAYDLEPAFVFRARQRPRAAKGDIYWPRASLRRLHEFTGVSDAFRRRPLSHRKRAERAGPRAENLARRVDRILSCALGKARREAWRSGHPHARSGLATGSRGRKRNRRRPLARAAARDSVRR